MYTKRNLEINYQMTTCIKRIYTLYFTEALVSKKVFKIAINGNN